MSAPRHQRSIDRALIRAWPNVIKRTSDGALTRRARKAQAKVLRLLAKRGGRGLINRHDLFTPTGEE